MHKTSEQYDSIIKICSEIFIKKMKDYGTAWRILRTASLTDQIFIKAQRIRGIELTGETQIEESARSEYIGIVNYAVMALIQLELGIPASVTNNLDLPEKQATELYNKYIQEGKALMERKNHDYGEAWRCMRISSLTDIILMKVLRTKQIEDNQGQTLISEGVAANYFDMLNYAIFALIKLEFGENK